MFNRSSFGHLCVPLALFWTLGAALVVASEAAPTLEPTPLYKPSSRSPEPLDIRTNAYGATRQAPDALELGQTAPDFRLPTAQAEIYELAEQRSRGDVVVVFYRGHW